MATVEDRIDSLKAEIEQRFRENDALIPVYHAINFGKLIIEIENGEVVFIVPEFKIKCRNRQDKTKSKIC